MGRVLVQAYVGDAVEEAASEILRLNGLDMSTAIELFLAQVVRVGDIPFEVRLESSGPLPTRTLVPSEDFDQIIHELNEPMPPEAEALIAASEDR